MNVSSVFAANYTAADTTTLSAVTVPTSSSDNVTIDTSVEGRVTYTYNIKGITSAEKLTGLSYAQIVSGTGKLNSNNAYIKFTTDGKFDISITNTGNNNIGNLGFKKDSASTSILNSSPSTSSKTWSQTNLSRGSYTFSRSSSAYVETLTITVYAPTSDEYNWSVATNSELNISADEISFESDITDTLSNTFTYTGSAYIQKVTKLDGDTDGVSSENKGKIGSTSYDSYDVTVTLQKDWFEAKSAYTVSGTVYDSATTKTLANATVSATSGDASVGADGTFNVTGVTGSTTITFSADNYTSRTITYSEATTDAVVDLVPKTINDNTNTATANKAYARTDFTATTDDNIDTFNGYNINGFKFNTDGIKLQMVDSQGNATATTVDGFKYVGRFNIASGSYISYTPSADGTLAIIGKTGSSNSTTVRGVDVKKGDETVKSISYETSDMGNDEVAVDANAEYRIYATGGAVNIYELKFTPSVIAIDTVASDTKVAHVKYNDKHYAVVTIADIADVVSLLLKKDVDEITDTDTVYSSVTFDKEYGASSFNTGITSGGYVFAFAIEAEDSDTDDTIKDAIAGITVTAKTTEATEAE
jgi:hypothetical protein